MLADEVAGLCNLRKVFSQTLYKSIDSVNVIYGSLYCQISTGDEVTNKAAGISNSVRVVGVELENGALAEGGRKGEEGTPKHDIFHMVLPPAASDVLVKGEAS